MRESGVLIYSHNNKKEDPLIDDLVTPFLSAVDLFSSENFNEKIDYIALNDGRKLHFTDFKINSIDKTFKLVAVLSGKGNDSVDFQKGIMPIKWLVEKNAKYVVNDGTMLPSGVEIKFREKISQYFE
jgi:hypothetical protein